MHRFEKSSIAILLMGDLHSPCFRCAGQGGLSPSTILLEKPESLNTVSFFNDDTV